MIRAAAAFEYDYRRTSAIAFKEVFHAHLQMEFTYVHEGEGNLILDGRTYAVERGTLMVFQPFQLHRVQMKVTPERPFIRSVLLFDPALLQAYWNSFPALKSFFIQLKQAKSSEPVYRIEDTDPLLVLLQQFHEARLKPERPGHELQEEYMFFLLNLLRQFRIIWQQPAGHAAAPSRYDHRAEEIMQWIEQHYQEPFRLKQLASELHLSHYHIAHLFKDATGTTLVAYVQATRVRHACVLLSQTTRSIPEIAMRTGIPNPSYFCRVFRQMMGITPHQYRLRAHKP